MDANGPDHAAQGENEPVLDALRPDLSLHRGPPGEDGSPAYTLYDPVRGTYDKLGWAAAAVLSRLFSPKTLSDLMEELAAQTSLRLSPEEVLTVHRTAEQRGLTTRSLIRPAEELAAEVQKRQVGLATRLLRGYLYFRIPLIKPDAFLGRTLGAVRRLASLPALAIYALVTLLGFFMLLERPGEFFGTFPYFFNLTGLFWFSFSVVCVKTVHEFAHAYAAKALGVRVPVMGLAFIVFWPVAFCDVTDAWRLGARRERLIISAAGMAAELVIAGFALFGWGVSPPGLLRSIFFVISSSSLASTILVNCNPAMRYDGYYLLMDLWGLDNLQTRAFAATRWLYRKWLLGIEAPCPEKDAPPSRLAGMAAYSIYCWTYRLLLYAAIAALVYYKFTKALGLLLFGVEVWWFILGPAFREVRAVFAQRGRISFRGRLWLTGCAVLGIALWLGLPLERRYSMPAVTVPADEQVVYAPYAGRLASVDVRRGQTVSPGQALAEVVSDKLVGTLGILELEREILLRKKEAYSLDEPGKAFLPQASEELDGVEAQTAALRSRLAQSELAAGAAGAVFAWNPTLCPGRYVREDEILGKVAVLSGAKAYAFAEERLVADIKPGDWVSFSLDADPGPHPGRVVSVSPVRAETMKHAALTSQASGSLPVIEEGGRLFMLESRYAVEVILAAPVPGARFGQSGRVWLQSPPRSLLADLGREALRVIMRESGF